MGERCVSRDIVSEVFSERRNAVCQILRRRLVLVMRIVSLPSIVGAATSEISASRQARKGALNVAGAVASATARLRYFINGDQACS